MRELTNLIVRSAEIHGNFLLFIQARISKMLLQSMITVVQKINFNVFQSSSKVFGSKWTKSHIVSLFFSQLKWPKHACQGGVSQTFRELSKIYSRISSWNFYMVLGTHTKFQLEILITIMTTATHKFCENILESSRNVSETPPFPGTAGKWHWIVIHTLK